MSLKPGADRIVKPGRQNILPGVHLIYVCEPEYPETPSWFKCGLYNADHKYIGSAVYSKSFIEYHTEAK